MTADLLSRADTGPSRPPKGRLSRVARITIGVAVAGFVVIALVQAWTNGPTYDEGFAITGGVAALSRHDLRVISQHPPFGKTLAAIPVLFVNGHVPNDSAWKSRSGHDITAEYMSHAARSGKLRRTLFAARIVPILLSAATAVLIGMLAARLFGSGAGLFAALLFLANPFVIGIGQLDGIDMPAALTTVAGALAALAARRHPSRRNVVIAGICGGAAILARITGFFVVVSVIVAVSSLWWRTDRRRALVDGATVAGVSWLTVMVAYAVLSPVDIPSHRGGIVSVLAVVAHLVMPPDWLSGTAHLFRVGREPGPAFILGHAHTGMWLWFWPASMIVKLPPTTLLVLVAGPFAWLRLPRERRFEASLILGVPFALNAVFTLQQQRPIGLRYMLPALALWFVIASPLVTVLAGSLRTWIAGIAVAAALATCVVTPSISWTDPLLGEGYRQAADSNLDWGQAYYSLQKWSSSHRPWVDYFGGPGLVWSDFPGARDFATAPAQFTGWLAVSASKLTAYERDKLAWLRAYCPVGVLDRTVLIYRFVTPPDRTLHGPADPPGPCGGTTSVVVTRTS